MNGRRLEAAEKRELWQRWRDGQTFNEIGRALGRRSTVVRAVVASSGGFVRPVRRRSTRELSLAEREEISRLRGSVSRLSRA